MDTHEKTAIRSGRNWNIKAPADKEKVEALGLALGIDAFIANLLVQRGIEDFESAKEFFRPALEHLHDPLQMLDMDKAVERIAIALSRGENILVYGDYDVDGTTAVALVYNYLKASTQGKIAYYIPDRYTEGYGISFKGIDFAYAQEFSLIIALDCGIRSSDKVQYAREKGIDMIICDHHIPGNHIPEAVAVLDPKRSNCNYPYKELSGCGIGFKLIQALHQAGITSKNPLDYLDLVALSIAADIVPVTGENRILAYYGLQSINQAPREGIKTLLSSGKERPETKEITLSDLVFQVAPRINAAGRLEHGRMAVELLSCENPVQAQEMGARINQTNQRRKDLDLQMTTEAMAMVESNPESENRKSTILFHPDWHKGVVGIVASRLMEKHYKPTIVLTMSEGLVTGSARSIRKFDIHQALSECADLLLQFGGHAFAAGLSLKPENLDAFIRRFEEIADRTLSKEDLKETIDIDLELEPNAINPKFYRILKQFAPFGPGNMSPVLLSKGLNDDGSGRIVGNNHLKLRLGKAEQPYFDAIAFGKGEHLAAIQHQIPCDVCYTLEENHWNGKVSLQWMIKDMRT